MIRLIVIFIYLILYLILSLPVLLAEWIIGKFNPQLKDKSSKALVSWGFRCIQHLAGVKLIVLGRENIPADTAVLYVGNHRSFFDIVLTLSCFPGITGYVAKKEMNKAPILRLWMRNIHCLFLDRENIKEGLKTILAGIELIKSGVSICIFPEGTRNRSNEPMLPFKEGSVKMAEKTGCLIIPMAITNSAEIFENHIPRITPCDVIVEYGEPIDPKALSREEKKFLGAYCQKKIQEMLTANQQKLGQPHSNTI